MDPVNLDRFFENAMEDEEFLIELMDIFIGDTPSQLERLRTSLSGGDCEDAAKAAHRLKGSSGNVGAEQLFALAQQLELAAKGSALEQASELAGRVDDEFERVKAFLEVKYPH